MRLVAALLALASASAFTLAPMGRTAMTQKVSSTHLYVARYVDDTEDVVLTSEPSISQQ